MATFRTKPAIKRVPTAIRSLSGTRGLGRPDVDVAAMCAKGGPYYADLRAAIIAATGDGRAVGGAELFNSLSASTRRPVDIHGLLHVAAQQHALRPGAPVEEFLAVRSSGEEVTFLVPEITFVSFNTDSESAR